RTGLVADSWMKLNSQLLIGLRSQSSSSYMIQFFVMLAVALGIASVLVVSVVQKSKEIGILKATGTSTARITRIFLIQGAILGMVGSLLGSGLGTLLSLLFASLAKNPDGSPTFPVDLGPQRFFFAVGIAVVIGLVAAVAPARRAARLDPAQVIRYG
ncbi:MAG: FtsX-like permease family protein, partial [Coriobacteriia bacterium]|nr:FtsX-like permease family protein [Coriobacteriia bacterium]